MAREAERMLADTGWLPEILRLVDVDSAPAIPGRCGRDRRVARLPRRRRGRGRRLRADEPDPTSSSASPPRPSSPRPGGMSRLALRFNPSPSPPGARAGFSRFKEKVHVLSIHRGLVPSHPRGKIGGPRRQSRLPRAARWRSKLSRRLFLRLGEAARALDATGLLRPQSSRRWRGRVSRLCGGAGRASPATRRPCPPRHQGAGRDPVGNRATFAALCGWRRLSFHRRPRRLSSRSRAQRSCR